MKMKKLRIALALALPADTTTSTLVVYGGKGTGKTNCATVIVEELDAIGSRFAVLDPMGVLWGLRHDESGKGDGIKVLILGGIHGALPITPESGAIVADLVVDENDNVIIDISRRADGSMWSIGERVRFVTDFAKRLYQRQGEKRRPIHLVIDEAARFAPQVVRAGDMDVAKCLSAIAVIVEEGRNVGIGVTLVTQRSARLNKDVAELADCMFAFRTVGPNSVRAVLDWLGEHVEKARFKEIGETLRSLPRGSALVVSPGWLEYEGIVAIRKRKTFDSSKTPESGKQVRVGPGARLDLEKYRALMAAVVEKAQENDPAALKRQVAALKKELANVGKGYDRAEANEKELHAESYELRARMAQLEKQLAAKPTKQKIVKVDAIKAADLRRLEKLVKKIEKLILRITGTNSDLELHLTGLKAEATKLQEIATKVTQLKGKKAGEIVGEVLALVPEADKIEKSWSKGDPLHHAYLSHPPKSQKPPKALPPPKSSKASSNGHAAATVPPEGLRPAHLRFLSAIAWWESIGVPSPDLHGVAFIAKSSTKSSAFINDRSFLRTSGFIEYPTSGHVQLTEAGRSIAPPPSIPATNEALHNAIFQEVTPALQRLLSVAIKAYPDAVALEDFAEGGGASLKSSAFINNRSWLRARGLVEYPQSGYVRAAPLLFPEAS